MNCLMNFSNRDFHLICTVIISALLFKNYYYYYYKNRVVLEPEPCFSLLDPSNTTQQPVKDVYDRLIDINDFKFVLNPPTCANSSAGFLLLVIVSSAPGHALNRHVIRTTWGQTSEYTKVVFLMGKIENSSLNQEVQNESLQHGDIVQGNFVDAYRNMTYKHVMGLKWVAHHCPMAKYVLKADDDIVVHSDAFKKFLVRELSPWGASDLILCYKKVEPGVFRTNSKWAVTVKEYPGNKYPDCCAGYAIVYSQDVVIRLLDAAQNAKYFWIDDVHVTGSLAKDISVEPTQMRKLMLSQSRSYALLYLGPFYSGRFLFGPRDLPVEWMLRLWDAIKANSYSYLA